MKGPACTHRLPCLLTFDAAAATPSSASSQPSLAATPHCTYCRRHFLAACHMRLDVLVISRELGSALLAAAIQLAAVIALEYGG